MTDEELTQRKRTLDLQLEAGIALLRDSHHAQVRALERLWSATREESAGAVPEQKAVAPAPVKRRKHRAAGSLYDEVVSALDQIAGDFDKNDVCRLLATAPERSSLFRVLRKLEDEHRIEAREFGSGRRTTTYRKTESG
jgi:hypothetical protein